MPVKKKVPVKRKVPAKKKHIALTAISKKKNPLIYNPHNPNHVSGRVKGPFLWDPYKRVYNVDKDTPQMATAPVVLAPMEAPTPRYATFDQSN